MSKREIPRVSEIMKRTSRVTIVTYRKINTETEALSDESMTFNGVFQNKTPLENKINTLLPNNERLLYITNIEHQVNKYELPVDVFLQYATLVSSEKMTITD